VGSIKLYSSLLSMLRMIRLSKSALCFTASCSVIGEPPGYGTIKAAGARRWRGCDGREIGESGRVRSWRTVKDLERNWTMGAGSLAGANQKRGQPDPLPRTIS